MSKLNYGAASLGAWITGAPVYVVKRPLEKAFTKGTHDFYEDLENSIANEQKRSKLRSIVSCAPDSPSPNLKRVVLVVCPGGVLIHVKRLTK